MKYKYYIVIAAIVVIIVVDVLIYYKMAAGTNEITGCAPARVNR